VTAPVIVTSIFSTTFASTSKGESILRACEQGNGGADHLPEKITRPRWSPGVISSSRRKNSVPAEPAAVIAAVQGRGIIGYAIAYRAIGRSLHMM